MVARPHDKGGQPVSANVTLQLVAQRLDSQDREITEIKNLLTTMNSSLQLLVELGVETKHLRSAITRSFERIDMIERALNGVDGAPGLVSRVSVLVESNSENTKFRWLVVGAIIAEAIGLLIALFGNMPGQ